MKERLYPSFLLVSMCFQRSSGLSYISCARKLGDLKTVTNPRRYKPRRAIYLAQQPTLPSISTPLKLIAAPQYTPQHEQHAAARGFTAASDLDGRQEVDPGPSFAPLLLCWPSCSALPCRRLGLGLTSRSVDSKPRTGTSAGGAGAGGRKQLTGRSPGRCRPPPFSLLRICGGGLAQAPAPALYLAAVQFRAVDVLSRDLGSGVVAVPGLGLGNPFFPGHLCGPCSCLGATFSAARLAGKYVNYSSLLYLVGLSSILAAWLSSCIACPGLSIALGTDALGVGLGPRHCSCPAWSEAWQSFHQQIFCGQYSYVGASF